MKNWHIRTIAVLSACGIGFSGYLTYSEVFKKTCVLGGSCPVLASIPACAYGLVVYFIIFVISILAIIDKKKENKQSPIKTLESPRNDSFEIELNSVVR